MSNDTPRFKPLQGSEPTADQPNESIEHPAKDVQKLKPIILLVGIVVFLAILVGIIFNVFNFKKKAVLPPLPSSSSNGNPMNWVAGSHIEKPESAPVKAVMRNASGAIASSPVSEQVTPQGSQQTGQLTQEQQQAALDLKAAMKAPISQNEITPQTGSLGVSANGAGTTGTATGAGGLSANSDGLPKDDQSMTAEKRAFIKNNTDLSANVLSTSLNNPVAGLVLAMGTKIPAILDQGINSELPGQIYGHVGSDVYDSRTHSKVLIPAGSNLVGNYDSAIAYGQTRLLVAWKRVNFPNGQWLDIQGMGGADPVGSGLGDQVDNHYWQILGATLITSVLAAGAQLSQPQQSNALVAPSTGQVLGQSVGTQISSTGTQLVQKTINLQPTIHIRPGFEFTVEVNKDIVFPGSYTGNANKK